MPPQARFAVTTRTAKVYRANLAHGSRVQGDDGASRHRPARHGRLRRPVPQPQRLPSLARQPQLPIRRHPRQPPLPPKHILSEITGVPTSDFTGGDVTNRVFRELGFPILELRGKLPTWHRDEAILLLDLYLRLAEQGKTPLNLPHDAPEITELSGTLRRLPLHGPWTHVPAFRNPNGIHMKLMNLVSLDPNHDGKGLQAASQLDRDTWTTYAHDPDLVHRLATSIRQHYATTPPASPEDEPGPDDDAETYPEGRLLYRLHRKRERNQALIRRKKQQASSLACEVCGFDFHATYGELGRDYAECHHTKPVSTMQPGDTTQLADLAIVCANCHRMLPPTQPQRPDAALTIDALREILANMTPEASSRTVQPGRTSRAPTVGRHSMTQRPQTDWRHLSTGQLGRLGEYWAKIAFAQYGYDVYAPELDDKGIDFLVRTEPGHHIEVQVKSFRTLNYRPVTKNKLQPSPHRYLVLAYFNSGWAPELYLIPTTVWLTPNALFVSRDYEGKKSPPEWGISLSKTNLELLASYEISSAIPSLIDALRNERR